MKEFSEVAMIKNVNTPAGYVLRKGLPGDSGSWLLATMPQFNKLVKEGRVQYFQWDESLGKAIVKYTNEEMVWLTSRNMPMLMGSDYVDLDMHLKEKYIQAAVDGYIYVIPIGIYSMPIIGTCVSFILFCKTDITHHVEKDLRDLLKRSAMLMTVKSSGNNMSFSLTEWDIMNAGLLKRLGKIVVDTGNLERKSLQESTSKMVGYAQPSEEVKRKLINKLNGMSEF